METKELVFDFLGTQARFIGDLLCQGTHTITSEFEDGTKARITIKDGIVDTAIVEE